MEVRRDQRRSWRLAERRIELHAAAPDGIRRNQKGSEPEGIRRDQKGSEGIGRDRKGSAHGAEGSSRDQKGSEGSGTHHAAAPCGQAKRARQCLAACLTTAAAGVRGMMRGFAGASLPLLAASGSILTAALSEVGSPPLSTFSAPYERMYALALVRRDRDPGPLGQCGSSAGSQAVQHPKSEVRGSRPRQQSAAGHAAPMCRQSSGNPVVISGNQW